MKIALSPQHLSMLYGSTLLVMEKGPAQANIIWKPKPTSRILFVLREQEIRNKELTEFLRKIVEATKTPLDQAGFGVIKGTPTLSDFQQMPNPYAVVFDHETPLFRERMLTLQGNEIFFTQTLAMLQSNPEEKKALWEQLKRWMA